MPARPRGSGRGSFNRISSTIRKLDKRKKTKTPPPPRIFSRIRSNSPIRRSRSSRSTRDTTLPRSPPKRRLSSSPGKTVSRKPRDDLRASLEPKRGADPPKNRERTPEKKYMDKLLCDGPSKSYTKEYKKDPPPSYTKEDIKNLNVEIPNYLKQKFVEGNYETNRRFNEMFTLPRREGLFGFKKENELRNRRYFRITFGVADFFLILFGGVSLFRFVQNYKRK